MDSTIRDIEKVMSGVNVVYERDSGITYRITTIIVRTVESDPYSSFAADTLLTQMRVALERVPHERRPRPRASDDGEGPHGQHDGYSYVESSVTAAAHTVSPKRATRRP